MYTLYIVIYYMVYIICLFNILVWYSKFGTFHIYKSWVGQKVRSGFWYDVTEKPERTFWPTQYSLTLHKKHICSYYYFEKTEVQGT